MAHPVSAKGSERPPAEGRALPLPPLLALLRPHQWIKNLFVAAPLFFTPAAVTAASVIGVALGVIAFCFVSSGVYIVNDYLDRDSDRLHPRKRRRPLAAGTVTPLAAAVAAIALMLAGFAIAAAESRTFFAILAAYFLLNLAYSLRLRHVSILDVLLIAAGFVLRVEAGGALIRVEPTVWITIITGLLALFLALAKRRDDLVGRLDAGHRRSLDGYTKPFLDAAIAIVLGALLVGYLIYTTEPSVMQRLGTTKLFYTAPFVIAGVLRYLQIALVEERSGSPTLLVLTDRFLILAIAGWAATFAALIYS